MLPLTVRVAIAVLVFVGVACASQRLEYDFFRGNPADRVERMRHYALADQYRIFRYGNDHIEPPVIALARPIAERGSTAVPFLGEQLANSADDLTTRDLLQIFSTMVRLHTYNVRGDQGLMMQLETKVGQMRDPEWRRVAEHMLQRIKRNS
jgi:hypothetical protein